MDLKQEFRELLFRTERARKEKLHPIWNELGLIAGQPRVLSQLYIRDHLTQKELADACCIEPATLSRALDRLENMGYITRNANPACRRSFLIALTEEGRGMAGRVRQVFAGIEEEMLEGFTEEEILTLMGLIGRVKDNLKKEPSPSRASRNACPPGGRAPTGFAR